MDIKSIIEKSINVTNNLDDISGLCSNISTEAKKNLFDKDNYATTIVEIIKNKKSAQGKILLTRELMKQCMLSIQSACNSFENICSTLIEKRDEKNGMSGENHGNNITLVPSDKVSSYYFINPTKFEIPFYKPAKDAVHGTISPSIEGIDLDGKAANLIEGKKIEECGTIITLLTETMPILLSDVSWLRCYAQNLLNSFLQEVNNEFLASIRNVNDHVLSSDTVVSLTNRGTEDDKSQAIIDTIDANCDRIFLRSQAYKLAVNSLIEVLTAININSDIMIEALNRYVSVDSLL